MRQLLLIVALVVAGMPSYPQSVKQFDSGTPATDVSLIAKPLTGFVDMHCHPRGDLAYGTELFFGTPYGNIDSALGNCSGDHAVWGLKNKKGNVFRAKVAAQTEQQYNKDIKDSYKGYPDFVSWPTYGSILHQQMWVDWIERAHHGGLNIMVALAVHSHCIATAAKTKGPWDDEKVMLNIIQGIKDLAASTNFMEIAYTPADVRRIVGNGKLAVIIGSEMENIGNFYNPAQPDPTATFNPNPTNEEMKAELDKLYALGIRYIFPIHITNNIFGGTAICMPALNVCNKYNTGSEFIPEVVNTKETGISFVLTHPILTTNPEAQFLAKVAIRLAGGILPKNVNPSIKKNYTFWKTNAGEGHRNSLGLTDKGRFAIQYMMQKGMMIDIDHMSEKTQNAVLEMAVQNDYPVNSGHNSGLRDTAGTERLMTMKQYRQIKQVGGMVACGNSEYATNFVKNYRKLISIMGYKNLAIGSDCGGFYPLPHVDKNIKVMYDHVTLSKCITGNRTWDINVDGMAHYGLFPDYIKSWEVAGMTAQEKNVFMSSAEHFTLMWEKCELRKSKIGN